MRLVDRVLRPLFPKNYHYETQVMMQLMSHDKNVDPYALLGLAASTALTISDIPFEGPISEVRVGRINGDLIVNPSSEQLLNSDIDLMIGASMDSVVMVEGEMKEISEEEMIEAIKFGHEAIKVQCEFTTRVVKKMDTIAKREVQTIDETTDIGKKVNNLCYEEVYKIASKKTTKKERSSLIEQVKEQLMTNFSEEELEQHNQEISKEFYTTQKKLFETLFLTQKKD